MREKEGQSEKKDRRQGESRMRKRGRGVRQWEKRGRDRVRIMRGEIGEERETVKGEGRDRDERD